MSVTFHPYVEQGSDEWLAMRCGMLTASGRQGVTACHLNPIFPPTTSPRPNEPSPARRAVTAISSASGLPPRWQTVWRKSAASFVPDAPGKGRTRVTEPALEKGFQRLRPRHRQRQRHSKRA